MTDVDLNTFGGEAKQVGRTCEYCVALNNCVFYYLVLPTNIHEKCKCIYINSYHNNFSGIMDINKITKYLFVNENKKKIFESFGYTIEDSVFLQQSIVECAEKNYAEGRYILKTLDKYGQRIGIETEIYDKVKKQPVKFYSGWIVYSNCQLKNTTPFAGWVKE